MNRNVAIDARQLSSGTIATLTGIRRYDQIDQIRYAFMQFVERAERTYETWEDAWLDFFYKGEPC